MHAEKSSSPESHADREIVITRVIAAPARLLFEAYSKPEHMLQWFGPKGYPLALCELDFRKGGKLRMAMKGPDGKLNPAFGGEYLEIVPNEKIAYSNGFEAAGSAQMVVTVTFVETAGKTTLTVTTVFETAADKEEHARLGFVEGTNSGIDNLVDYLAKR